MPVRIVGPHHVSFTVSELERSVAFYRRLGFEEESRVAVPEAAGVGGKLTMQFMTCPGLRLELLSYERGGSGRAASEGTVGDAHIALQVVDIAAAHAELSAAGVEFASPPRYLEHADASWAFLHDPDGIRVELVAPGERVGA